MAAPSTPRVPQNKTLRIRTITAGVHLDDPARLDRLDSAISMLERGRERCSVAGFEVQTLRIATNPFVAAFNATQREHALRDLQAIDDLMTSHGTILSIGPVLIADRNDPELAQWAAELAKTTKSISFSVAIAADTDVHSRAANTAAQVMIELSRALADGMANFRFAAAANIPAGTPFFPVAWHQGEDSLAFGLESASLVEDAFVSLPVERDATMHLRSVFNRVLAPIAALGAEFARSERRTWLGIDASPAPTLDRSIAGAIEAFTHQPFGSASTLQACAAITAAIKSLEVKTCGYSGLMLPVLEDPLLAQRAVEGRYTLRDLLLYSSVCGTGLDVVPIPGDTPRDTIAALLRDIAALSTRLNKALSARLFLVPGKSAGEIAKFDDAWLIDSVVMKVD
ncbi:MAG TPA: DUF711 family protein [Steroidobacteraceae bacterium]|nr:DUF711 family protein [Steroidobacteraceae bacterium]